MATVKDNIGGVVHECFYKCDSRKHSSFLTLAIIHSGLSDEKLVAYLKWCCAKYPQGIDSMGRSLTQVAASKGRLKLLLHLLKHKEVNINAKDQESSYSALHRSLFYGQLHCAVRLIQVISLAFLNFSHFCLYVFIHMYMLELNTWIEVVS